MAKKTTRKTMTQNTINIQRSSCRKSLMLI
jgi:hypothetical protein